MTSRDRIRAAISGKPVDRVPVAFWRHFPGDDQRAESLAAAHVNFQKKYQWDFLKVTPASGVGMRRPAGAVRTCLPAGGGSFARRRPRAADIGAWRRRGRGGGDMSWGWGKGGAGGSIACGSWKGWASASCASSTDTG